MKNVFKIDLFFDKLRQILLIDIEQNFHHALGWIKELADSLSSDEKSEAVKISEGLSELKKLLQNQGFLEDSLQAKYFDEEEKEILLLLDKIHNPENYPAEATSAKKMSFSDKKIQNLMQFIEAELIPLQTGPC